MYKDNYERISQSTNQSRNESNKILSKLELNGCLFQFSGDQSAFKQKISKIKQQQLSNIRIIKVNIVGHQIHTIAFNYNNIMLTIIITLLIVISIYFFTIKYTVLAILPCLGILILFNLINFKERVISQEFYDEMGKIINKKVLSLSLVIFDDQFNQVKWAKIWKKISPHKLKHFIFKNRSDFITNVTGYEQNEIELQIIKNQQINTIIVN